MPDWKKELFNGPSNALSCFRVPFLLKKKEKKKCLLSVFYKVMKSVSPSGVGGGKLCERGAALIGRTRGSGGGRPVPLRRWSRCASSFFAEGGACTNLRKFRLCFQAANTLIVLWSFAGWNRCRAPLSFTLDQRRFNSSSGISGTSWEIRGRPSYFMTTEARETRILTRNGTRNVVK